MEFQVEKHAIAAGDQFLDDRRPVAGEELAADLESADRAPQLIGQLPGLGERIDIERDEELFHAIHSLSRDAVSTVPTSSVMRSIW